MLIYFLPADPTGPLHFLSPIGLQEYGCTLARCDETTTLRDGHDGCHSGA